jgi:hypothetical protein
MPWPVRVPPPGAARCCLLHPGGNGFDSVIMKIDRHLDEMVLVKGSILEASMLRNTRYFRPFLALVLLGLAACGGGTPTTDPSAAYTQIWQTVADAQTQTALAVTPTPSLTPTPEVSPTPQASNTPLVTNTPLPGAATASPAVISSPVPTLSSNACDNANFVSDVTIPDGTEVPAGSSFVKTWRFKNLGPCTWTGDYHLVYSYVSDTGKNGVFTPPGPVAFPKDVLPGEEVDLSVTLTAPTTAATYQVVFILQNNNGFSIPLVNFSTFEFYVNFVVK